MLYTIGYTGWKYDDFIATVRELGLLADVRFRANSRWPRWCWWELAKVLGPGYVHLAELGNKNYRGKGPVELADYRQGRLRIQGLLRQWPAIVLMCSCADLARCHRSLVAERLRQDLAVEVRHLPRPGQGQQESLFA